MKIYFDESEDSKKTLLLLSAIFVYNESNIKGLRDKINLIKKNRAFFKKDGTPKEIKYNRVVSREDYDVAKEAIDSFFGNGNTYFRCCVVNWNNSDLMKIGGKGDPLPLRKAILYTRITHYLLKRGLNSFRNAVLLYDELVRCKNDIFEKTIEQKFGQGSIRSNYDHLDPKIKTVRSIFSNKELNNTVQITDLLMGCVLNNNRPTKNGRKNSIRDYLIKRLNVTSLKKRSWSRSLLNMNQNDLDIKFDIDYIDIKDFINNNAKKNRKNRN